MTMVGLRNEDRGLEAEPTSLVAEQACSCLSVNRPASDFRHRPHTLNHRRLDKRLRHRGKRRKPPVDLINRGRYCGCVSKDTSSWLCAGRRSKLSRLRRPILQSQSNHKPNTTAKISSIYIKGSTSHFNDIGLLTYLRSK